MDFTNEDLEFLRSFRDKIDYDGIKIKQQIKEALLGNKYIIRVLNNDELENKEAEADEYYGVNILPYYLITPTQSKANNFICFTVSYDDVMHHNNTVKYLEIRFVILCESKTLIDEDTSLPRHDLLAALVQDQFNHTNLFGPKVRLTADVESIVDNDYACRTLTFTQYADNNIVQTIGKTPTIINKQR